MFDCNSFLRRMGWRQKDLSERLGISTSTVGMWCAGKSTPAIETAEKLIRLGMTPKELYDIKHFDAWEKEEAYKMRDFVVELFTSDVKCSR